MENHQPLATLFQKFINNSCSPEETEQLMDLLKNDVYKKQAEELIEQSLQRKLGLHKADAALHDRLEQRLQNILGSEEDAHSAIPAYPALPNRQNYFRKTRYWWAAAAVILVLLVGGFEWFRNYSSVQLPLAAADPQKDTRKTTNYIRNISLPDGSTVILKEGSTLDYNGTFNRNKREVTLVGEAFFDIAHDQRRAFTINTGKIKTTVLGTSFNIKAYPGQQNIIISVTSGKVKVEDSSKILAVLTKDQQVVYNPNEDVYKQQRVNAASVVSDWTKQDMEFENNTFLGIAGILEKRFGVHVAFSNPALEQCTITASFNGTESLEKVLEVLCLVRPATYSRHGDKIIIDGEGCK